MELLHIVSEQYPHITKIIAQYPFQIFLSKKWLFNPNLGPPKNHIKIFKNQMLLLKPPYNILHFINILLSPNICTFWDTETFLHSHPIFLHFQIWPFWPQKHKNSNLTNSFLVHCPQPKMNQKSPKGPKSILILTMKLLFGRCCL